MYLKQIEIYGFKSFANRVRIDLYPNVNIIVGPNGCGKSNIVDAIKWSIGEMSRKALRMPSMIDVIFSGTTKRQQMNLAEVTLVFDNSEKKINFDFNEIAITRKIYRSEESEYFINRVPCRLKDIKEMFLDTGIGCNGYSIIDQGEIEKILLLNADERREIFEEVAGIAKYRAKREETLRKLEKVEADLFIVENSISLIEQQIKKLEQEVKKAKLHEKYIKELKESEIAYNIKIIKEYSLSIDGLKNEMAPILNEIEQIEGDIKRFSLQLVNKELTLNEKILEEKDYSEKISNTRAEIARVESNIIKNEELLSEISKQLVELNETHEKNLQNYDKYIPILEDKRNKLNDEKRIRENIDNEFKNAEAEFKKIEEEINKLDRMFKEIEAQSLYSHQNEINISGSIAKCESELSHIREELVSLNRERDKLILDLESIKKEISEKTDTLNRIKAQQEDILNTLNEKKKIIDEKKSRFILLEREISKTNMEIVSLQGRLDAMIKDAMSDTYWVGINEILKANIEGVLGILRDIIKFNSQDKYLIEDAFGEFLDSIVVKDRETAFKCIEYLKTQNKGRARFLILENVPQIVIPNEHISTKISYPQEYKNLINHILSRVIFDNSTVISDIFIVGGISEVSTNEPYWGEISDMKSRLELLNDSLTNFDKEYKELKNDIVGLEKEIEDNDLRFNNKNIEFINISNDLKNLDEKRKIIEENISFVDSNISTFTIKEKEVISTIEQYNLEINQLRNISNTKKQELKEITDKKIMLNRELMDKKGVIGAIEYRLLKSKEENQKIEMEIKDLENKIDEINREKENYASKKNELEEKISNLRTNNENLKIKLDELNNDRKEFEIKRNNLSMEIEVIKTDISRINSEIKENNEVLKEYLIKKQDIDLKINTLETKIEDIKKRLFEEYQVNFEDLKDRYNDFDVNQERIEYLKKRIENIGAVNMIAPQEYDLLVKEYNDKKIHIDDLKIAKENLKQAISKINQMTKDNFKETFNKVNEHFKKIYATLFNGGTANLVLTNPDDLLETGIEIMAHPPGKRLVNISQLSGGEKSLTALALLFSFFCANPSPFCVMDEVDAALDEANIERFVRLIKEFSSTTQFIIITHNKRTMEAGDRLYGVTMEELGVSKVISVDLKRAVDMTLEAGV